MHEVEPPKKYNRREALKFFGIRTAETGVLTAATVYSLTKAGNELQGAVDQQNQLIQSEERQNLPLQTYHFAERIIDVSEDTTKDHPEEYLAELVVGSLLANYGIAWMMKDKSEITDRGVGVGASVLARGIDTLSTIAFAKYMEDPRFEEYGFAAYFKETSNDLPDHPNVTDVVDQFKTGLPKLMILSGIVPMLGRNYLGSIPAIFETNIKGAHRIKECLEIGDTVKAYIELGKNKEFIDGYLESLRSKNNSHPQTDPTVVAEIFSTVSL